MAPRQYYVEKYYFKYVIFFKPYEIRNNDYLQLVLEIKSRYLFVIILYLYFLFFEFIFYTLPMDENYKILLNYVPKTGNRFCY